MYDWSQHGGPQEHTYRGFYDAGVRSTTKCGACGRGIRFVYGLHDRGAKAVLVGACCFRRFGANPRLHAQLQAARTLQEAYVAAIDRDVRLHGEMAGLRQFQAEWRRARREALGLVREYRKRTGEDWLPRELFALRAEAEKAPGEYKKAATKLRWFRAQAEKLDKTKAEASAVPSI